MSSLIKWEKGGLKTPMARAKGLGSAKDGVEHWMGQRVTAISNLVLLIWFVWYLMAGVASSYESFTSWLGQPLNAVLSILLVISTFYHAYLGAQVVTEDYVHNEGFKLFKLISQKLFFLAAGIACVFCILKISFAF